MFKVYFTGLHIKVHCIMLAYFSSMLMALRVSVCVCLPFQFFNQWTIFTKCGMGPTQPSVQREPGREADHSNPEVKNAWSYTSTLQYVFIMWCFITQEICVHSVVLS
jgi:hypothetical protein